jgi:hypothetical protein
MGLGEDGPVLASLRDEVIMNAGSRVDDYISRLPDWQQAVCQQVRQLVHHADPEVEETIKRSVLPYLVLQGSSVRGVITTKPLPIHGGVRDWRRRLTVSTGLAAGLSCMPGSRSPDAFSPASLDAYLLYMLIAVVASIAAVTALA